MEPRALDGGARSFLFLLCTYVFYNLPVSRFGYTGANGNEAQQIQNEQVDNSSQPGPKPKTTTRQEYVFSNLPVSGIQGQTANGNEAPQIQNKQVDNNSLDQTKPKTTRLQKRVSCGMVLMASTMLHEKCCNTVLQIGALRIHR